MKLNNTGGRTCLVELGFIELEMVDIKKQNNLLVLDKIAIAYSLRAMDRVYYCFFSEFFRSIGLFVDEVCDGLNDEELFAGGMNYPMLRIVDKASFPDYVERESGTLSVSETNEGTLWILLNLNNGSQSSKAINCSDYSDTKKKIDILSQVLDYLGILYPETNELIETYVNNNVMLHSLNMQYFTNRPSQPIESARLAFNRTHKKLESYQNEKNVSNPYFEYSALWYAIKANEASKFMRQGLLYPVPYLEMECKQLIKKYSSFYNAVVLLGLCYRGGNEYAVESVNAFGQALMHEKQYSHASSIYYWLGKRYEMYDEFEDQALNMFLQSNKKKNSHRSKYKIGKLYCKKGMYQEAVKEFQELIDKLSEKREKKILSPVETEYMFKAYAQLTFIYSERIKYCYTEVIRYGRKALKLRKEIGGSDNIFFSILYRDEQDKYKELSKRRMSIFGICIMLADSYSAIDEKELADQYRNAAMKMDEYKRLISL